MEPIVVGIGDCKYANGDSVLATYALGSCIAVLAHDNISKIGGLLHFVLPEVGAEKARGVHNPYRYGDLGLPHLFEQMRQRGASPRGMVAYLAGGAQMFETKEWFNIGKKNYLLARKLLWQLGVMVRSEEVGGSVSRTVRLDVATGKAWIRTYTAEDGKTGLDEVGKWRLMS